MSAQHTANEEYTMAAQKPAKTPAVAIARVLRGLGLKQGRDFSVAGHYVGGERRYTYVSFNNAAARDLVTENADRIEGLAAATGFAFSVSVRYHGSPRPWPVVRNGGTRVRECAPQI